MTDMMNHGINNGLCSNGLNAGAHALSPAKKRIPMTADNVIVIQYEKMTIFRDLVPARGKNRIRGLLKFSCEMPDKSIIAEIAAEFNPTTSTGYVRAAKIQYKMPRPDVDNALNTSA
jgi:hypothetical protein